MRRWREGRLYGATHADFTEYCHERWGICRSYAWRVMGAAERISLLPKNGEMPCPKNEFQVRPFLALNAQDFPRAWERAVAQSRNGRVTRELANRVISEIQQKRGGTTKRRKFPSGFSVGRTLVLLDQAKQKIQANDKTTALCLLDEIEEALFASGAST